MTREGGFSLVEMLVSMTVLLFCLTGLATLTVESSQINRTQQMTAQTHANARNCMAMIVQKLRGAGWDPMNAGIGSVIYDADLSDGVSQIEVFADLDSDRFTNGPGEQVLIRHLDDRIEWRPEAGATDFLLLATGISNDADGDGVVEEMFTPISDPAADRILVQITAESPIPDPTTGQFIRYTARSEVTLRKTL